MTERVVVAMSGGVDSSVAAALLKKQGFEVIGVGLRLPESACATGTQAACCGLAGMRDARIVAGVIGIPFYVLNYEAVFTERVIAPFCQAYAAGRTPNPCVDCNAEIKFGRLLQTALAVGAGFLATGHYARIETRTDGARVLRKGVDLERDQSYFLYRLTQTQLEHTLFPVGGLSKGEVRAIARRFGLPVSDKPGSQDICFAAGSDYLSFVASRHPDVVREGEIVDERGWALGRHHGIAAYTVGQRKGLGIAASEPLYVKRIDAAANRIVVAPKERLGVRRLRVEHVNWIGGPAPAAAEWRVKVRYRAAESPAEVVPDGAEAAWVSFEMPQPAVACGQSAVFYEGDLVVGGGIVSDDE